MAGGSGNSGAPVATPKPKLLQQVRDAVQRKRFSPRTEESYIHWIRRFVFFHGKRHPVQDNPRESVRARGREMEQEAVRAGNRESGSWKKERLLISTSRSPDLTISRYKRG